MSTTTATAPTNDNGERIAQQVIVEHPPHPAPSSTPPPAAERDPPAEPDHDHPDSRCFSIDGIEWVAWVAGTGTAGTGSHGLGRIEAVHFAPAANGDRGQHREALIALGRFPDLFDDELLKLFGIATPIDASRPTANNGRRNGRRR